MELCRLPRSPRQACIPSTPCGLFPNHINSLSLQGPCCTSPADSPQSDYHDNIRASVEEGRLVHHEEPPIYTGDRLHPKGVLLFTIFGKEMVDKVGACCSHTHTRGWLGRARRHALVGSPRCRVQEWGEGPGQGVAC